MPWAKRCRFLVMRRRRGSDIQMRLISLFVRPHLENVIHVIRRRCEKIGAQPKHTGVCVSLNESHTVFKSARALSPLRSPLFLLKSKQNNRNQWRPFSWLGNRKATSWGVHEPRPDVSSFTSPCTDDMEPNPGTPIVAGEQRQTNTRTDSC